jgi:long-chain acyl-CoA synthetase
VSLETERTIRRLWRDATAQERPRPAYLVEENGGWREVSWAEAERAVDELANGLLALGVRKGDPFGILASTRLEWVLFDFALALVGAIGAPVYMASSPRDAAYVLEHSDAVGVLVEDEEQREKIAGARLEHVLTFADLDGLRTRGREFAAAHPDALDEAASAIGEDDLFTYIYTSGTTGPPKACMITHRNYYEMAAVVDKLDAVVRPDDVMLLYLPLAHNFGRLMHLLSAHVGFTLAFCPDPLRIAEMLPQVRPTLLPSVPRVYEKLHAAVVAAFDEGSPLKRRIARWALGVGTEVSRRREAGTRTPPLLALRNAVADRLVFSKVRKKLGGRFRLGISGGAPLPVEIGRFFHALGILIVEGYGLTECTSAATVNRPERFRFGTVGPALPGAELRIADDGEILIRTVTNFAGYYKDEAATREILDDEGWLHSGDIGHLDDGFLTVTDRKKDLIVTAGGKNIPPQNLENALKASKYISQVLVVGDRRPYVAALVTLDDAAANGLSDDEKRVRVQEAVDRTNRDRSRFEQIKRFAILPRDFSAEEDEVTPTLKLKRRVCEEHFAAEIEMLYRT